MKLIDLVLKFPDKSWNWYQLSCNPNITFQNVLDHPDLPWAWYWLSENPNITFQNILDHPDLPWDWCNLSINKFKRQHVLNCQRIWRYYYHKKRFKAGSLINNWLFEIYMDPDKKWIGKSKKSKLFDELKMI